MRLGKKLNKMKIRKKVFILGASSDIGIEIMKIYIKNNYEVFAHYNNGNRIFKDFTKKNKIKTIRLNFLKSNFKTKKFLISKIFKKCDVLINAIGHIKPATFSKTKISDLESIFKVNYFPGLILSQVIGKEMIKRKWGRIVNLGSIGVKFGGGLDNFPYALSKFMLEFFPSEIKNWTKQNVLVNTIRVGATDTKLHLKLPNKNLIKRKKLIPIKRFAKPKEIARFVYFLGSNENTYISNQVLSISGGE